MRCSGGSAMQTRFIILALTLLAGPVFAANLRITSLDRAGTLTWSNAFAAGVVTVESNANVANAWQIGKNYFTSNSVGAAPVPLPSSNVFVRLAAVDISTNTPLHYTNLLQSYGILETIAGRGQFSGDHINYYSNSLEGGFATNMNLSRPHIAFGDAAGNVLIVDQGSSAIEKVTPDGRIHTFAGTHVAGNNGEIGRAHV